MEKPRKSYAGRRLDFYFSSEADKKRFHEEAEKKGCTDCKFLRHVIDDYFHRDEEPRSSSPQDLQNLREEVAKLKKDLREADRLTAVQDELIQSFRNKATLERGPWHSSLIEALQDGPIHDMRLLEILGIDMSNGEAVRAISRQLEILEANGTIRKTPRGWKWKA